MEPSMHEEIQRWNEPEKNRANYLRILNIENSYILDQWSLAIALTIIWT